MNKKSERVKQFKPWPIIVILIIILGSAIYICIDSYTSKKETNNNLELEPTKSNISEEEQDILFKKFFDNLSDTNKNDISLKDLTDSQKLNIVTSFFNNDDFDNYDNNGGIYEMGSFNLSLKVLQNINTKYFDTKLTPPNEIYFNNNKCTLNNTTYDCVKVPTGVESINAEYYIYVPIKAEVVNNQLTITGVKVFTTSDNLYTDETKNNNICQLTEFDNSLLLKQEKECVNNYTDSLKEVSITFDIKDNQYIFNKLTK